MRSANAPNRSTSAAAEFRGATSGNWAQAESEIWLEMEKAERRTADVIDGSGVRCVRYDSKACDGDSPGEFPSRQELPIRFEGEKMFVQRPNGSELETTIVAKVG
jgi:hypothetical protein